MDLSEAIRYVLDGDAVIIMGAGASYGAKNQYGEFPSGSRLAKDLYALCGINPDDENDLADASQIYSEKFSEMQLINEIRDRLLSYSHIFSIIHGYNNVNEVLSRYFDSLSEIEYYKRNNFFWLQYAISCMEISEYDRAQVYLNSAYGFAPEDFVPFQINNQQARLYLKKIIAKQSAFPLTDFKEAHRLLMLPIVSEKDNEFNVVKLFGYYIRKDFKAAMNTDELKQMHELNCKDAYNRTEAFIRNHPEYYVELNDLSKRLYSAAFD